MIKGSEGLRFAGTIGDQQDLDAAARLALSCRVYRIDTDDEDFLDGVRSCFNCRYRRWLSNGFSCAKGFPTDLPGQR
jgi:hypothetical protein